MENEDILEVKEQWHIYQDLSYKHEAFSIVAHTCPALNQWWTFDKKEFGSWIQQIKYSANVLEPLHLHLVCF